MEPSPMDAALDPASREFYCRALDHLQSEIPFLVGGAYSFARHTGIERHTKDFDIFVLPADAERVLAAMIDAGYRTRLAFPHWLGKVYSGDNCLDVIFGSGNGVARVDAGWFAHAVEGRVLDRDVLLCPVEETIWSKSFIMERERFDGADIAHLIRAAGSVLDWERLVERFAGHWRVLLMHLVLFGFVYPSERDAVPNHVLQELTDRLRHESNTPPAPGQLCQGTLISRSQYLVDIEHWGYDDARLASGAMSPADVDLWTEAIGSDAPTEATRPTLECPVVEAKSA